MTDNNDDKTIDINNFNPDNHIKLDRKASAHRKSSVLYVRLKQNLKLPILKQREHHISFWRSMNQLMHNHFQG